MYIYTNFAAETNLKTMAKRKYSLYIVAGEFCEEGFESYRDAFKEYQRCETATLYGVPTYDSSACEVIMSK